MYNTWLATIIALFLQHVVGFYTNLILILMKKMSSLCSEDSSQVKLYQPAICFN